MTLYVDCLKPKFAYVMNKPRSQVIIGGRACPSTRATAFSGLIRVLLVSDFTHIDDRRIAAPTMCLTIPRDSNAWWV
jgi:hypothetical protein